MSELAASPAADAELATARWSSPRLLAFRFGFSFVAAFWLPTPFDQLPGGGWLASANERITQLVLPWFARHVLGIVGPLNFGTGNNSSSDTTVNYAWAALALSLAAVVTVGWSIAAPRTAHHAVLERWLRVYVRVLLAWAMLHYGLSKVFGGQFPALTPAVLERSYGESSPMGLLWTFMGASMPYKIFGGAGEVLGGVLLCFRRTTTLGALVLIAVLSNVVALNLCYDVPVKLYSTSYLLFAVYLASADVRRLLNLLVWNRATRPAPDDPLFRDRRLSRAAQVAALAFLAVACFLHASQARKSTDRWNALVAGHALLGTFEVEEQARGGKSVPHSDTTRWQRVTLDNRLYARLGDGSSIRFGLTENRATKRLTLSELGSSTVAGELTYAGDGTGRFTLEGKVRGEPLLLRLRKLPEAASVLQGRGFHLISEQAYSR